MVLNYLNSAGDEEISIPDHGMVMTTFYYRYVDYQSGLLKKDNWSWRSAENSTTYITLTKGYSHLVLVESADANSASKLFLALTNNDFNSKFIFVLSKAGIVKFRPKIMMTKIWWNLTKSNKIPWIWKGQKYFHIIFWQYQTKAAQFQRLVSLLNIPWKILSKIIDERK